MKTNTYAQFKEWVKLTCVNKIENKDFHIYEGDTAHAVYTAWYIFKHNLSEEEVTTYIEEDVKKSSKRFGNNGFTVNLYEDTNTIWNIIPKEHRHFIELDPRKWPTHNLCESGGDYYWKYGTTMKSWEKVVRAIYNYWKFKLMEEQENEG